MFLKTFFDSVEIRREEKMLIARFVKPFRSLSTCRVGGGFSSKLEYVCNHQCCEPRDHFTETNAMMIEEPHLYHKIICENYGLPCAGTAILETAANMNNAAIEHVKFRKLEVSCICTGGVESNPMRAADPASIHEYSGKYMAIEEAHKPHAGTINVIILINSSLTDSALVECVVTATEAKAAALQELEIHSRYSDSIATGTGTDQIFVAARIGSGVPLTGAGKHTKLGEMVALSSLKAIKNTLIWQNSLTPNVQCSCMNQLGHTNLDESQFVDSVCSLLDESLSDVFRKNFISINLDPPTVASLSSLKLVRQKSLWGVLPQGCIKDTFCAQAAQIACCVSGKYTKFDFFRRELSVKDFDLSESSFMKLVYRTFALGFSEKWK